MSFRTVDTIYDRIATLWYRLNEYEVQGRYCIDPGMQPSYTKVCRVREPSTYQARAGARLS